MGACGSTEEQQQLEQLAAQRQQRQQQLAASRMLELWLVDPIPRRKINARAIETAEELAHRIANELEIDEEFWRLVQVEFSDVVLEPTVTLEQAGIETVRGCRGWCVLSALSRRPRSSCWEWRQHRRCHHIQAQP